MVRSRFLRSETAESAALSEQVRRIARPLSGAADLDPLMERIGDSRYALLGEASHGRPLGGALAAGGRARCTTTRRRRPRHHLPGHLQRAAELRRHRPPLRSNPWARKRTPHAAVAGIDSNELNPGGCLPTAIAII